MVEIIQHSDVNVGPASYNKLSSEDALLVTKIFYTIQGEGPYAGCPAVFIRLAGCNRGRKEDMGCRFCDTDFRFANGVEMTPSEIMQTVGDAFPHDPVGRLARGPNLPLIVITGGEPMMQDNLPGLICKLVDCGYDRVQVESNGDRLARRFAEVKEALEMRTASTGRIKVDLIVSPKVTKNGYQRLSQDVLDVTRGLKFVVSANPADPYYNLPTWALGHDDGPEIWLSPMTVYRNVVAGKPASAWDRSLIDHEATQRNFRRASELILKYGLRGSMQQHLWWGVE